jgi:hypothetical protein
MTTDDVQRWLDRYVQAWRTYQPESIAALFTENATYAYQPWAEPLRGRKAIVADWLDDPDSPGSWQASYRPLLVDGEQAVITGETRYEDGKVFSNMFVVNFDGSGRCHRFVEWYMLQPPR